MNAPQKLLVDGRSGVKLSGKANELQPGYYRLGGTYDAVANTLEVTEYAREEVRYQTVEEGKRSGDAAVPVTVEGLIATPPKEAQNTLVSYLAVPDFPRDLPVYPYVVYTKDGFYLALSDVLLNLPARVAFLSGSKGYSFTFGAGAIKGTLLKTPPDKMSLGAAWKPEEFGGVIIAGAFTPLEPVAATVRDINANPARFAFKAVSINGDYVATNATFAYSDVKAPLGQGILVDEFVDLFKEDARLHLETLDPGAKAWRMRRGRVTGTVIYPTEQILKYLDYSAPLSAAQLKESLKPALIVDAIVDATARAVNLPDINPVFVKPIELWGKVIEFDGYAIGVSYILNKVAETILKIAVPVNVNLIAVGVSDKQDTPMLAVIGLNSELTNEKGENIKGRFRFIVAVSHAPEELTRGIPNAETAIFLLSKKPLGPEPPKLYNLFVAVDPPRAGTVNPSGGQFASGTRVTLNAVPTPGYIFDHWSGDATGTTPFTTVLINADKGVTAHFRPN